MGCSNHTLRKQTVIGRMNARTEHFGSSFYPNPNCLKEWNDLPLAIGESHTVASFKSKLFSLIRPPQKPTYGIYDPNGLVILTQLRVGLSKLKSHKFNHNFRDTVDPMCLKNDGTEDTEHFLLQCHAYSEQSLDIIGAINEVLQLHNVSNLSNQALVRTILYGDERFTYNQGRQILEATVRFIRTSERFSWDHKYQIIYLILHSITLSVTHVTIPLCIAHVSILPRTIPKSTIFLLIHPRFSIF